MVEFLREVTQGRSTAGLHIVKDGLHEIGGLVGAHLGARHSSSISARVSFLPRRSMIRI